VGHHIASPSFIGDDLADHEETLTSLTGFLFHSTPAAAVLLQRELGSPTGTSSRAELARKSAGASVRRETLSICFSSVLSLPVEMSFASHSGAGLARFGCRGRTGCLGKRDWRRGS
jgi:hypothetical protein